MRTTLSQKLEDGRLMDGGPWSSRPGDLFGWFMIQGPCGRKLKIIASDGVPSPPLRCDPTYIPWEHVSVSTERHPPNWEEMSYVKDLFWGDDEVVMQLHPPKSQYVNYHPNCLHLWRPVGASIPQPDSILVGPKT